MPKYSQFTSIYEVKVIEDKKSRKDGKPRYRITFPKDLAESTERLEGKFVYDPERGSLFFDLKP